MKKYFLIILSLLLSKFLPAQQLDSILVELDKHIDKSDYYIGIKENKISKLTKILNKNTNNPLLELKCNAALFEEYKSFKYDSAYYFAVRSLQLAQQLNDSYQIVDAKIRLVFCYLSSGLFKESFDLVSGINISNSDNEQKLRFYKVMARLYYDMADYNSAQPFKSEYITAGIKYSEAIIALLPPESVESLSAHGLMMMKKKDYNSAIEYFQQALHKTTDNHEFAIAASSLGYIYTLTNQFDEAAINISKAAIADIKSATKETVALRLLAKLLYENRQEVNRAYKYVKLALDDANIYNARHRKIEIGSILPIIEKERINTIEGQRNLLIWLFVIVTLLLVLFLASTIVIYKQLQKIKAARQMIENQKEKVLMTNTELKEANNIKDKYIGHFFYINYQYIDKLERVYRLINRKIATKQYDELAKSFKESELENERKNMYATFDETFLKLFPDFINEYKKLFPPEEWAAMNLENNSLTIELRIFALIRLGISESEKIGKFLNYSVHTINTYKSKVKNKSHIANDLFEKKIMEIKYEKSEKQS